MRRLTLIAAAAATLLTAPAFALEIQTGGLPIAPRMGGPFGNPFAASPLASTNVGVNTNTAAGIGNRAQQQSLGLQQGGGQPGGFPFGPGAAFGAGGGAPLVSTNVGVNTNTAAGIGNKAKQGVAGVSVGFGRGGSLVDTNVNVNTNVAAGIGNAAGQSVLGRQGR